MDADADAAALRSLTERIIACRQCPRLVAWREQVAVEKRASFRDDDYWGRPVPGFGDPAARLAVVGLAPAAHGANRTGRMFTGDRSGDFLYAALYRTGWANQPTSRHRDDGLALRGAWITSAVRCAPPANKPEPRERDACAPWLDAELDLVGPPVVYLALGAFGYEAVWAHAGRRGFERPARRPRFAHGLEVALGPRHLLCSFHPSQQNTFTGRLTPDMLDAVLRRAGELAAGG